MRLRSLFTMATVAGIVLGCALGQLSAKKTPVADAPMPHAAQPGMMPDGFPQLEYKIPRDQLCPERVHLLEAATDAADWGLGAIDVAAAWKVTKGKGAIVAVLDTGVDVGHPDLADRVRVAADFTNSRSGASDVQGHGTHCAGVVAASENGSGMVGVAPEATLMCGKVLGDNGSGLSTWIANGIDWATANGAHVITMSLGSPQADARIQAAVNRALDAGVIVIAAAGNEGPREGTVGYPGGFTGVVCVAATGPKNALAQFSSRGAQVLVAAPGVSVKSTYPGGRFATMSGTSMATPHVAGCAALYVSDCLARGVKPTPAEFRGLVSKTSLDLPPAGRDTGTGYGLIQPAKLVQGNQVVIPPVNPPVAGDSFQVVIPPQFAGRKVTGVVIQFEPIPAVKP